MSGCLKIVKDCPAQCVLGTSTLRIARFLGYPVKEASVPGYPQNSARLSSEQHNLLCYLKTSPISQAVLKTAYAAFLLRTAGCGYIKKACMVCAGYLKISQNVLLSKEQPSVTGYLKDSPACPSILRQVQKCGYRKNSPVCSATIRTATERTARYVRLS